MKDSHKWVEALMFNDYSGAMARENWPYWSKMAWEGFTASGRGFVSMELSIGEDDMIHADGVYVAESEIELHYSKVLSQTGDQVTSHMLALGAFKATTEALATYDPEREVIFLSREPFYTVKHFVLALTPSPKDVMQNISAE